MKKNKSKNKTSSNSLFGTTAGCLPAQQASEHSSKELIKTNTMKKLYTTATLSLLTSGMLFFNFLQPVELKAQAQCTSVSVSADSTIIGSGSSVKLTATGGTNFAGNAISFDGTNDYVLVPDAVNLRLTSQGTVELWLKAASLTQDTYATIIGKANSGVPSGLSYYIEWKGTTNILCAISNGTTQNQISISPLSDLNWHHLAFTWDGAFLKIYKDGVEAATAVAQTINAQASAFNLKIGGYGWESYGLNNQEFKGQIDEVRVWNVARSAAQIASTINSSVPVNAAGLVGYWKMDEGTGTTTADATANGNTGTLTSGPLWVVSAATVYPAFSWIPTSSLSDSIGTSVVASPLTGTTYTVTAAATGTCSASSSTITIGMTGINQIESELKEFTLSPNPSNGKVQMSFVASQKDKYQMEVMNYIGQVVYSEPISTLEGTYSRAFDFTKLEKGVYLISLRNENSQSTRRIVIE